MTDNSNAVGSASLILRVDVSEMTQGLQQAHGQISSWAGSVKQSIGAGIGIAIGQSLLAGVQSIFGHFMKLTTEMAHLRDVAGSLGVPVSFIQSLRLAGVETQTAQRSMMMLNRQLSQAQSGNLQARATFEALGISMAELRGLGLEGAFGKIADRIQSIEDPGQRMATVMQALSRGGGGGRGGAGMAEMVELLSRGSAGLRELQATADRLHISVSDADAERLHEAYRTFQQIGIAADGVWSQLVVKMAPAAREIAEGFLAAWHAARPLVDTAIEFVQAGWEVAGQLILDVVDGIKSGVSWAAEWLQGVLGTGDGFGTVRDIAMGVFRTLGTAGAWVWDTWKAGVAIGGIVPLGWLVEKASVVLDAFVPLRRRSPASSSLLPKTALPPCCAASPRSWMGSTACSTASAKPCGPPRTCRWSAKPWAATPSTSAVSRARSPRGLRGCRGAADAMGNISVSATPYAAGSRAGATASARPGTPCRTSAVA